MLTGILLFLLIVLLLLAVPLTVTFNLLWSNGLSGQVILAWGNGLVHANIPIEPGTQSGDSKAAKHKKKRRSSSSGSVSFKALLRNKPFRERIVKYILDMWEAIGTRDVRLFMRIGLDNPADTGLLWAVLGPLSAILARSRYSEIALQPDFLQQTFALEGSGGVRIVPLRLLYLTLKLLLSPTIWSGLSQARVRQLEAVPK